MKKYTLLFLFTMSLFGFYSCENDIDGTKDINYISFESAAYDFGVELDGTSAMDIKVFATQVSGSDRSFNINVLTESSTADPASYIVPASVVIPANSNVGLLSVSISDINIGENGKTLKLAFEAKEGLLRGSDITLNIRQVCPFNEVDLKINFDGYASECTWELHDSTNTLVASGGPWADGDSSVSSKLCLVNGTYTFTIYDAYGDGLSYPSDGDVTLTNNGNVLVFIGGNFGSSESASFTVGQ